MEKINSREPLDVNSFEIDWKFLGTLLILLLYLKYLKYMETEVKGKI